MLNLRVISVSVLLAVASMACGKSRVWTHPTCVMDQFRYMSLKEVEFRDTATVLSFVTEHMPVDQNYVYPNCYLVDSNGERHGLLSAEGMSVGYGVDALPPVGSRRVNLLFTPIANHDAPFDFIESSTWIGRYMLGISSGNGKVESYTVKSDKREQDVWKADTVTLIGTIHAKTPPSQGDRSITTTFTPLLNVYQQETVAVEVGDDGRFEMRYLADRPALSVLQYRLRKFAYFAYPGDTLYIEVDNAESVNQSVSIKSTRACDVHDRLLLACVLKFPNYSSLLLDNYKCTTQAEFNHMIDSISSQWNSANAYLSAKYRLSPFESDVLKERVNVYLDCLRVRFAFLQEGLYRQKSRELRQVEMTEQDVADYECLRRINVWDIARFCADWYGIQDIVYYICNLNAFANYRAYPKEERGQVLRRWLALFFRVDESQLDLLYPFLQDSKAI